MTRDRIIQLISAVVLVTATVTSASLLPSIMERADRYSLRYTDVSVEGAPPWVALGTVIGALRGLIVDALWIKINIMKERGLFYEVMADAELITKLQPRFAAVWAFHGHNMAYNISVATHTEQERWEWVNAGIRLVRNEGLRYNPNDLQLHRELSFWFAHKIEGVSDDAHLFYKTQFCREWHYVLGEPPDDLDERIAWIGAVADAASSLEEAKARDPGVAPLLADLQRVYEENGRDFAVNRGLLTAYAEWEIMRRQSAAAEILGIADSFRQQRPFFRAFDDIANDPAKAAAWETLVAHLRKRTLLDDYNMDPALMRRYTEELGPIDWRHGQAHALYWSRRGAERGEHRIVADDDIYTVLNNDRVQLQAMQGLARSGRILYDPLSNELPARMPDSRWVDTIFDEFERLYVKHYDTRGGGPESFIGFLQNFMGSSIREWYRAGEREKAQALMDRMNALFGTHQMERLRNPEWKLDLDVFVWLQTKEQYEFQPHLAPSDVAASLRYGYLQGLAQDRPKVLEDALEFAGKVTEFFQGNEYYDYENKFGRGRMSELISALEDSALVVFAQVMIDRSIPLPQRMTMWRKADSVTADLRGWSYDRIKPQIERELATSPFGQKLTVDDVIPAPPNLEAMRLRFAEAEKMRQKNLEEKRARDTLMQRGGGSDTR